jgi:hypothetical protein
MTWFSERNPWFAGRNLLRERQFRHPSPETLRRSAIEGQRSVGTEVPDAVDASEAAGIYYIRAWLWQEVTAAASAPSPTLAPGRSPGAAHRVLTVQFALGVVATLTPDVMQWFIDRAYAEKRRPPMNSEPASTVAKERGWPTTPQVHALA